MILLVNEYGYVYGHERENGEEVIYHEDSQYPAPNEDKSVIKPSHYRKGDLECMDVIIAMTADHSGEEGFMIGNVIKYLWRWKEKNGVEDLKKAREYLDRIINELGD